VDGRARAAREEGIAIIRRLDFLVDAIKTFCGIAFVNETAKFGQIDRTRWKAPTYALEVQRRPAMKKRSSSRQNPSLR
jgi:hypothetical protein